MVWINKISHNRIKPVKAYLYRSQNPKVCIHVYLNRECKVVSLHQLPQGTLLKWPGSLVVEVNVITASFWVNDWSHLLIPLF